MFHKLLGSNSVYNMVFESYKRRKAAKAELHQNAAELRIAHDRLLMGNDIDTTDGLPSYDALLSARATEPYDRSARRESAQMAQMNIGQRDFAASS